MASCRAVVAFDVAASVSLRPLNLSLVEGQNGGLLAATLYRSALWLTRIDTNGTQGDNVRHSLLTRFERGEADALQVKLIKLETSTVLVAAAGCGILRILDLEGNELLQYEASCSLASGSNETATLFRGLAYCGEMRLAVGNSLGEVLLFDVATNALVTTLYEHRAPIADVASNGKRLAAVDEDGNLHVWELAELKLQFTVTVGPCPICMCFMSGYLLLGTDAGSIHTISLEEQRVVTTTQAHTRAIYALAPGPDGTKVASAGCDGRAIQWRPPSEANSRTPTCLGIYRHSNSLLTGAAYDPLGRLYVTAYDSFQVFLVDEPQI